MRKTIAAISYIATLAVFTAALYFVNDAIMRRYPEDPLVTAWQAQSHRLIPFLIPFAIAWLMPDWRWLAGFVAVNALGGLSALVLPVDYGPGAGSIAQTTKDLAITSGAGAGFLAGVVGRALGLVALKVRLPAFLAWPAQIIPALILLAAAIRPGV